MTRKFLQLYGVQSYNKGICSMHYSLYFHSLSKVDLSLSLDIRQRWKMKNILSFLSSYKRRNSIAPSRVGNFAVAGKLLTGDFHSEKWGYSG